MSSSSNDGPQKDAYRDAGVNIEAAESFVSELTMITESTARPGADAKLGGFGGLFDLKAAGYKDPLLVAATDGVGTKLKLAYAAGRHRIVGIDLVAMCVNDLVVQGAEPLFFLDYMATGKLDKDQMISVANGIATGCRQAGAALIGGETAEMPGFYKGSEYDLAGFCVGAVERNKVITGDTVKAGDLIVGLESSGPHANGFSLIRAIIKNVTADPDAPAPWDKSTTLGEALLEPTRIYVKPLLRLLEKYDLKAMAHITGGGFLENIPRCLPEGLAASVDARNWPLPPIFEWLQEAGDISVRDMVRTFNCGIGMALIVSPEEGSDIRKDLKDMGLRSWMIGKVKEQTGDWRCRVNGESGLWGEWSDWSEADK